MQRLRDPTAESVGRNLQFRNSSDKVAQTNSTILKKRGFQKRACDFFLKMRAFEPEPRQIKNLATRVSPRDHDQNKFWTEYFFMRQIFSPDSLCCSGQSRA